jgi:hypothetical protein
MVRVWKVLACLVALAWYPAVSPAVAAVRYEAFQWYSAYDPTIDGSVTLVQNDEGVWTARVALDAVAEGTYLVRLVVPTTFYRRHPAARPTPARWTPVEICELDATGRGAHCVLEDLPLDAVAEFIDFGVIEIWRAPDDARRHLPLRWASAPLHLSE